MGRFLPDRVITSAELEDRFDLRRGSIERKLGVRERRWAGPPINSSQMGAAAAREALEMAGLRPKDLDLIINSSGTQHRLIPDGGPILQQELGIGDTGIPSFSVHSTCLSFLTSIELSAYLIASGRYRRILIVSSENASIGLDFREPYVAALFGDGAAAAVVEKPTTSQSGELLLTHFETYGEAYDLSTVRLGTERHPVRNGYDLSDAYFRMDGKKLYRSTIQRLGAFFERLSPDWPEIADKLSAVVSHQTTRRGLYAITRFGVRKEIVVNTLHKFGNCVAASIPMTLYEAIKCGAIRPGQTFLLCGTGAGLSIGAAVLRF